MATFRLYIANRWHKLWNGTKMRVAIWGDFVSKEVLEGSLFVLIFTVNRYSLRFSITVVKHANQRCICHIPDQSNEILTSQWIRVWRKIIKTNIYSSRVLLKRIKYRACPHWYIQLMWMRYWIILIKYGFCKWAIGNVGVRCFFLM